ncbi:hypothetical protein TL16_g12116 [Triparma laevis f. inornata]|uniref:Uncharacterized protein n=1 Tax=Triparma laevis f. inornata TaxID=1714386 RepID=A0A9W7BPF6_9STRA|nr:hypothetical protein TL16_g12116 [Triparma laevis f. inornata]
MCLDTVASKALKFDFSEESEKEKLVESGTDPTSLDSALDKVFDQHYVNAYIQSLSQPKLIDSSNITKYISEKRWPKEPEEINENLVGLRLQLEDKNKVRGAASEAS